MGTKSAWRSLACLCLLAPFFAVLRCSPDNPYTDRDNVEVTIAPVDPTRALKLGDTARVKVSLVLPNLVDSLVVDFGDNGRMVFAQFAGSNRFDTTVQHVYQSSNDFSVVVTAYINNKSQKQEKITVHVSGIAPVATLASGALMTRRESEPCTLSVNASGIPPLLYRWTHKSDTGWDSVGEKARLIFTSLAFADSGTYVCNVANAWGSTKSPQIHLTVLGRAPVVAPVVDSLLSKEIGSPCSLSVSATGTQPFAYRWYHGSDSVSQTAILSFGMLAASDSGSYYCVVSNRWGADSSNLIRLAVGYKAPPTVSFAQDSSQGDESKSPTIGLQLSRPSTDTVKVFCFLDKPTTATRNSDFVFTDSLVVFAPNQTQRNLSVKVTDDTLREEDERVVLVLRSPLNATLGAKTTYTYRIVDNEAVSVYFDTTASRVSESQPRCSIQVDLSVAASQQVTVDYSVDPASAAKQGSDFGLSNGKLVFDAGTRKQYIPFTVNNDNVKQGNRAFSVVLSGPLGAGARLGGTTRHTCTILDDDALTVGFVSATSRFIENQGTCSLAVKLSSPATQEVKVDYAVASGSSAKQGTDFTLANGGLTFAVGDSVRYVVFTLTDNAVKDGDRSFSVDLSNPQGNDCALGVTTRSTCTIEDNESVSISFAAASSSVSEAKGACSLSVELSTAAAAAVSVGYSVKSGGTATEGASADFVLGAGTLSFAAGEKKAYIVFTVNNDATKEGAESFTVALGTVTGDAKLGTIAEHTCTILDNDIGVKVQAGAGGATTPSGEQIVTQGQPLAIAATPNTGYRFTSWSTTNGLAVDSASKPATSIKNVQDSGTVTAGFERKSYTVKISAPAADGVVDKSGDQVIFHGDSLTITATPNSGKAFKAWTVTNGLTLSTLDNRTTVIRNVTDSGTVRATFAAQTFTVTVTAVGSGSISPPGPQLVAIGGTLDITAVNSVAGYQFTNWTATAGLTIQDPTMPTTKVNNVQTNGTVTANFALNTYTVTVAAGTGGTVSPSGVRSVSHDGSLSISATADGNYTFVNWTATGGLTVANPGNATTSVTNVKTTGTVTANFALKTYQLTTAAGPGGSVSTPSSSPTTVNHGAATAIAASPSSGYGFAGWTVTAGTATIVNANSASATVTLSAGNATVQASFSVLPPTVTDPQNATVAEGQTATFAITATGAGALSYQWQKQPSGGTFSNINGANALSYTTPAAVPGDNGAAFRCVVTNSAGNATTNAATLTVNYVQIGTQPANQKVVDNANVTFALSATGNPAPTYQWQRSVSGGAYSNITGAVSPTYTITGANCPAHFGTSYRCVVTCAAASRTSSEAALTIVIKDGSDNEYNIVKIGNQFWTKENLKTTKYTNGTSIPDGNSTWPGSGYGPAYCWYGGIAANENIYGALYNWYVVDPWNASGTVAPTGWKVPDTTDWNTLVSSLGQSVAGKKMKTTTLWNPNTGDNSSNFSAPPGGYRESYGTFFYQYETAWYWCTTDDGDAAHHKVLVAQNDDVQSWLPYWSKYLGLSVRLVRN